MTIGVDMACCNIVLLVQTQPLRYRHFGVYLVVAQAHPEGARLRARPASGARRL